MMAKSTRNALWLPPSWVVWSVSAAVWVSCASGLPRADRWGDAGAVHTARGEVVDAMHGVPVADPYRWLEDLDSPETRRWIDAQNARTHAVLQRIEERPAILKRLEAVWSYDSYGVPVVRGGRMFFTKQVGLENQPQLYVAEGDPRAARALVNPNALSEDGTIALTAWSPSPDGSLLAYATSDAGSDWRTVYVLDVGTGTLHSDRLEWVKFSTMTWEPGGRGFYYGRFPAPADGEALSDVNRNQSLYFHRVGTPQLDDVLVFERPEDPELGVSPMVADDGEWIALHLSRGTDPESAIAIATLGADGMPAEPFAELPGGFEAAHVPIGSIGDTMWLLTDRDAPRSRVVAVPLDAQDRGPLHWRTAVPETAHRIEDARLVGGRIAVLRLQDAASAIELFGVDGSGPTKVALPGLGTAHGFTGRAQDREDFFGFQSITHPPSMYRLNVETGASAVLFAPEVDVEPSAFVVDQVFYTSKDGTRIPMFLARHRDTQLDGAAPTLLYGYGGFDVSLSPSFSPARLVWLEMGGVFAMPNLRGGGEFGREWHEAGKKEKKQNVFDDFIAAGEYLYRTGITKPSRTAISGRSNGGLLVGAVLTQRPELFGAALPGVGVMDMLRFHEFTIGWAWVGEYGCADVAEEFPALLAYSPLHNAKPGRAYPATLVTTGDHDDRVVPSHSYKFAAALQQAQAGREPILIRIDVAAGHGAGKPTAKRLEEAADEWAFLVRALDFSLPPRFGRAAARVPVQVNEP